MKNNNDSEFVGIEISGQRFRLNLGIVILIKFIIIISPFGMIVKYRAYGSDHPIYSWIVRLVSLLCNLMWIHLLVS